uniref:Uncharacterized protein n=1 Tax=Arundo donax TaxID=35708 RepID=A0A0A9BUV3_ARUDO
MTQASEVPTRRRRRVARLHGRASLGAGRGLRRAPGSGGET